MGFQAREVDSFLLLDRSNPTFEIEHIEINFSISMIVFWLLTFEKLNWILPKDLNLDMIYLNAFSKDAKGELYGIRNHAFIRIFMIILRVTV